MITKKTKENSYSDNKNRKTATQKLDDLLIYQKRGEYLNGLPTICPKYTKELLPFSINHINNNDSFFSNLWNFVKIGPIFSMWKRKQGDGSLVTIFLCVKEVKCSAYPDFSHQKPFLRDKVATVE